MNPDFVFSHRFSQLFDAFLVLFFLDGVLTYMGVKLFSTFVEMNPFVVYLAGTFGWLFTTIGIKLIAVGFFIFMWYSILHYLSVYDVKQGAMLDFVKYWFIGFVCVAAGFFFLLDLHSVCLLVGVDMGGFYANLF